MSNISRSHRATSTVFPRFLGMAGPLAVLLIVGCNTGIQSNPFDPTADLPPHFTGAIVPFTSTPIIDGPGYTIVIDAASIVLQSYQPIQPGGQFPGGDRQTSTHQVQFHLTGNGLLAGWQRSMSVQLSCTVDSGVRPYGAPIQSFPNDLFSLQGQISPDPDFDLLRITAGTGFGMPSPGHTTLTQLPTGFWNIDTLYDITFRIDYAGSLPGVLHGQSGSQTRAIHIQMGQPSGIPPIPPGNDLWHAVQPSFLLFGGPDLPEVPQGFFDPGSEPFDGLVQFTGEPTAPSSADTDTIVRRTAPASLPSIGSIDTTPIEIVQLSLASVNPIVVSGNAYRVTLTRATGVQPAGTMTIKRTSPTGGTFDSVLPVRPQLIFTPISGGPDRIWTPDVVLNFASDASANWSSESLPSSPPGGGPEFFPSSPQSFATPSCRLTLRPAQAVPPALHCPPLDMNFNRRIDGEDIQGVVAAFIAGPSHPQFCSADANANGVADSGDIPLIVDALLTWPSVAIADGGYWNVRASCDKQRIITLECAPDGADGLTIRRAVRAADQNGIPSTCPVFAQLRDCNGVDVPGSKVPIEGGATSCIVVPGDRQLVVWCDPADGGVCRISTKPVAECP